VLALIVLKYTVITSVVFNARRAVCQVCEHWRGACLKGHLLQGPLGCPLHKFEGVDAVGYQENRPIPEPQLPDAAKCCGKAPEGELRQLNWAQVWAHLLRAVADWKQAGFALVDETTYARRLAVCQGCPRGQYAWFQCRHCRCIVYTKAKLATESCPYGLWPDVVKP